MNRAFVESNVGQLGVVQRDHIKPVPAEIGRHSLSEQEGPVRQQNH